MQYSEAVCVAEEFLRSVDLLDYKKQISDRIR